MSEDLDNDFTFGNDECPTALQKACEHLMNCKNSSPRKTTTMMMTIATTEMEFPLCQQDMEMEMTTMETATMTMMHVHVMVTGAGATVTTQIVQCQDQMETGMTTTMTMTTSQMQNGRFK